MFQRAALILAVASVGFWHHRAAPVTLAWDPSPYQYRVYVLDSAEKTLETYLTDAPEFTLVNLRTRAEYVFAVTAISYEGIESEFSDEVIYYSGR